jgi:hypothetical protein
MARGGCQEEPEPMHIVVRIVQLFDLVETSFTITGINDEDVD